MTATPRFSQHSTVGEILDDPQARALLEEAAPGSTTHPMIFLARGFTLADGAARLGTVPPELLAALDEKLRALG